jgi:hypothetical protein
MSTSRRANLHASLHMQPEIVSYKTNYLTISNVKLHIFTKNLFSQRSVGRQKSFRLSHFATSLYLRRKKQITITQVGYSREDRLALDTWSLFWNVAYKRAHMSERTTLSRSWRKTPTVIRISLSKVYVTFFCGAASRLKVRMTVF